MPTIPLYLQMLDRVTIHANTNANSRIGTACSNAAERSCTGLEPDYARATNDPIFVIEDQQHVGA